MVGVSLDEACECCGVGAEYTGRLGQDCRDLANVIGLRYFRSQNQTAPVELSALGGGCEVWPRRHWHGAALRFRD